MLKAFAEVSYPSFCVLFCANAFYSMAAARFGKKCFAVDLDKEQLEAAVNILRDLHLSDVVTLQKLDVRDIVGNFDVVLNAGGFYHLEYPIEVHKRSYDIANRFLIVQTAVSLAVDDPDYFETPAPGWAWGCRFSVKSFDNLIESLQYNIVERHFREFANPRLEDKGGLFYLIKK